MLGAVYTKKLKDLTLIDAKYLDLTPHPGLSYCHPTAGPPKRCSKYQGRLESEAEEAKDFEQLRTRGSRLTGAQGFGQPPLKSAVSKAFDSRSRRRELERYLLAPSGGKESASTDEVYWRPKLSFGS